MSFKSCYDSHCSLAPGVREHGPRWADHEPAGLRWRRRPTATINYSGADGTGNYSAYVYADPQVSYGTSVPLFYCVDLWHDNYIGSTYTITPVSTMAFANSTFSDVDNRIGWLLSQDQSTAEARRRAARDLVHG